MSGTRSRIYPGDGDPRHGTVNGYCNLKCKCDECKAAWAESHRDYMNASEERKEAHRERARLAYAALEVAVKVKCPICKQAIGKPCKSESGARVRPHKKRVERGEKKA